MFYKISNRQIVTVIVQQEFPSGKWEACIIELSKEKPRYITKPLAFSAEKEAKQWLRSSFIKHFPGEIFKG